MDDIWNTEMCVYKLTAKENEIAYVGQSTRALKERVNGSHPIVKACGGLDKLDVSVLATAVSQDALTLLETQYIFSEKTYAPHGLNRSIPACGSIIEKLVSEIDEMKRNPMVVEKLKPLLPSSLSDKALAREVMERVERRSDEFHYSSVLEGAYPYSSTMQVHLSPAIHPEIILELYNWASKDHGNIDRIARDLLMIGYMVYANFPKMSRVLFSEQFTKQEVKDNWY